MHIKFQPENLKVERPLGRLDIDGRENVKMDSEEIGLRM
jgi:hypothetical protein